jgi:hypothetical protein
MKRFRVTLLVVCLLLGWLGYNDLSLLLRNREPQQFTVADLETQGPAREWLTIRNGYQDLLQAINMSGTMEIDSFLVPLKRSRDSQEIYVWFETRDPQIVELLKTYYFKLNSAAEQQKFIQDNHDFINARREITGMTVDNLIADSNREKLKELLQEMQLSVPENVLFVSEGKEPTSLRGYFFLAMSLIGLLKLAQGFKSSGNKASQNLTPEHLNE